MQEFSPVDIYRRQNEEGDLKCTSTLNRTDRDQVCLNMHRPVRQSPSALKPTSCADGESRKDLDLDF